MSTDTRARLYHAINAWAATRSGAHSLALNAVVDSVCIELEMLRREVASQAESLSAAGETIAQLQAQVRNAAAPAVLQALEDLTIAYRTLAGLDGAWDQPLIRAERALISAKNAAAQSEPHPPDRQCGCTACLPSFEAAPAPVAPPVVDQTLCRAAERTREDLGAHGTNYPDVRTLLAFVERAMLIGTQPGTWAGPSSTACDAPRRSVPSEGWIDTDRERSAQEGGAA